MQLFLISLVAIVATRTTTCEAKIDRNQPHDHSGKLTPYSPGPFPNLQLTSKDEEELAQGKPVMKQSQGDGNSGGAICVQDIHAPKAAVWNQILDLGMYTKKVNKVIHSSNYHVDKSNASEKKIKTKMVLGVIPGYSYESYYDHTFFPEQDSMTWTLDYEKTSDMDDVSGHWHLEERDGGLKTRVFYACDISLKGSVPGPVLNYLSKAALKSATSWVKKQSEENVADFHVAEEYGYKQSVPSVVAEEAAEPVGRSGFFGRGGAVVRHGGAFVQKSKTRFAQLFQF